MPNVSWKECYYKNASDTKYSKAKAHCQTEMITQVLMI